MRTLKYGAVAACVLATLTACSTTQAPTTPEKVETGTEAEVTGEVSGLGEISGGGEVAAELGQPVPGSDTPEMVVVPTGDVVTMVSKNFAYEPNTLTGKVGQPMVLQITSTGFHDIVIDELGVDQDLTEGANTVTFTPSKAGTFKFYCSIGKHREMGMEGTITITE